MTQTELVDFFGVSSICMGKKLVQLKLKDSTTKLATHLSITKKLGINISYTKKGQEIHMAVWKGKVIEYLHSNIKNDFQFCSDSIIGYLKKLKDTEENDTGQKLDMWNFEYLYDELLKIWSHFDKNNDFCKILIKKLKKENLLEFAEGFDVLKDIRTIY